jgi:hypothetical protein
MTEGRSLDFPDDADGDALRRMAEDGNELTRPMQIDFTISVPSLAAGHAVAQAAQEIGYRTSVERDEETETWTCYCSRHMVASYDAVILAQEELSLVSALHGGHCDGWGSFGNTSESNESDSQR